MKKLLTLVLAMMLAMSMFTAAAMAEDRPKVVISRLSTNSTPEKEALHQKYMLEPLQAAFPDYEIVFETFSDRQTLLTQVAGGAGPDIFSLDGPTDAVEYAKAGRILDLTPYAEQYGWKDIVFEWAYNTSIYDGKLYSVPNSFEGMVLFFNDDVFAANGWEHPTTAAELVDLCEKCQEAGIVPLSFGNSNYQGAVDWLYSTFLSCYPGTDTLKSALRGELSWNDPKMAGAIQLMVDWWKEGYLGDCKSQAITNDDMVAMFARGEAAMMINGTWAVTDLMNVFPDCNWSLDLMVELNEEAGRVFPLATGGCYVINASAKYPDACAAVLNHFFTDTEMHMNGVEYANWQPYPVKSFSLDAFSDEIDPKIYQMYEVLMAAQASNDVGLCSWTFYPADVRIYMNENTDRLFLDMLSVEDYMTKAEELVKVALDEGSAPTLP